MPNNRKVVEQRLYHLKRRLQKDPEFHMECNTFINDLLVKGYAEKVPEVKLDRNDGRTMVSTTRQKENSVLCLIVLPVTKGNR